VIARKPEKAEKKAQKTAEKKAKQVSLL